MYINIWCARDPRAKPFGQLPDVVGLIFGRYRRQPLPKGRQCLGVVGLGQLGIHATDAQIGICGVLRPGLVEQRQCAQRQVGVVQLQAQRVGGL